MTTIKEVEEISEKHLNASDDYRNTLSSYAVALISAQLATLGFLIHDDHTRSLLKIGPNKGYFVTSLTSTFFAFLMLVTYKKLLELYYKHGALVQLYLYSLQSNTESLIPKETIKSLSSKSASAIKRNGQLLKYAQYLAEAGLIVGIGAFFIAGIAILHSL
jgi:hypothetical protein